MNKSNRSPKPAAAIVSDDAVRQSLPPTWLGNSIVVVVGLHFFLFVLSIASAVKPSTLQSSILNAFAPYLDLTHFNADGVRIFFSDSALSEKMHRVEKTSELRPEPDDWNTVDNSSSPFFGGMPGGDRQRRWQRLLATMADLGEQEQGAIVAWLMEPVAISQTDTTQLRIVRVPDLMTTVVDDNAPPPYIVNIVRGTSEIPRLIQLAPKRLASPAVVVDATGSEK